MATSSPRLPDVAAELARLENPAAVLRPPAGQDGGIAAFIYEHEDAGCGDMNWLKSLLYVAGWRTGSATLNDELLYEDYQILHGDSGHARSRHTATMYPLAGRTSAAGAVNPALQHVDFYIRSPDTNDANHPSREVFDHFFAMETTRR